MGYEFLNYVFGVWVLMLLLLTVLVCVWVTVRIRYWWRKGSRQKREAAHYRAMGDSGYLIEYRTGKEPDDG